MFLYDYKCEKCEKVFDLTRVMSDRDRPAECKCGGVAHKIFSFRGAIGAKQFEGAYYHAFGKNISSRAELRETLAVHKGETGQQLYQVGNDKMSGLKPKKKKIDFDSMGKELYQKLKGVKK